MDDFGEVILGFGGGAVITFIIVMSNMQNRVPADLHCTQYSYEKQECVQYERSELKHTRSEK
jgi:hypothetical protein